MGTTLARLAPSLAALLLCASCASTDGEVPAGGTIKKPTASNGFVSIAAVPGLVIAEARFVANQEDTFGVELTEDLGIVPVFIKIGLPSTSGTEQDVQLSPEQMDFRLVLQDGTALETVRAETIIKENSRLSAVIRGDRVLSGGRGVDRRPGTLISEGALQPGFLRLSGGVKEGYVYFLLKPAGAYEVEGSSVVHSVKEVHRELDLSRSLMSFKLTRGGQTTSFFIGVAR